MKITMSDVRTVEELVTVQTVKEKSEAIDLVEYFFPTHVSLLFQMQEKFLYVE